MLLVVADVAVVAVFVLVVAGGGVVGLRQRTVMMATMMRSTSVASGA